MATGSRFLFLLIVVPVAALAAWRQNPHSHSRRVTPDPNWTELMGSMDTMHIGMASIEPSGNSDVDFVKLMLPHHQGAVGMAKAELAYGKDPQMVRLAQQIVTDQESEIQLMQLWLHQHGPSPQDPKQTLRAAPRKEQ
jgi:uncharacterized protein (DUF305 family)